MREGNGRRTWAVAAAGLVAAGLAWWIAAGVLAQDQPEPAPPAKDAFDTAYGQWQGLLNELRAISIEYKLAERKDREAIKQRFDEVLAKAKQQEQPLIEAAIAAYRTAEDGSKRRGELAEFLFRVAQTSLNADDYARLGAVAEALVERSSRYAPLARNMLALAEFRQGHDEQARSLLAALRDQKKLEAKNEKILEELEFRAVEAAADDLPRVEMETAHGKVVIELFENEAPNTVANFLSLVEKKFYDGLTFHRVLADFMAQGGDPQGTGAGGPGYTIDCECYLPKFRKHFRGSLAMAHAGRNTGGSQFYIVYKQAATEHLDGQHTVFGRVLSGMEAIDKLRPRDPGAAEPSEAEKIISIKVLRKRDHDYTPKTKPDPRAVPAASGEQPEGKKPADETPAAEKPANDKTPAPEEKSPEEEKPADAEKRAAEQPEGKKPADATPAAADKDE